MHQQVIKVLHHSLVITLQFLQVVLSIKDGGVVTAELADDVTTAKINDANVTNAKLASTEAVTSNKMASLVTINILASDGSTVVKTIFTRLVHRRFKWHLLRQENNLNSTL